MDRRVQRTRAAVLAALLDLVGERRWERISVQDVIERAGVSRSTFYAHYDNKLDVITSGVPEVAALITVDPATGTLDVAGLFEHAAEMAEVIGPLLSQPVLGELSAAVERGLAEALGQVIDEAAAPRLASFAAGALLSSLRVFATQRPRPPAAEVAAELSGYLARLLDGHLRPALPMRPTAESTSM